MKKRYILITIAVLMSLILLSCNNDIPNEALQNIDNDNTVIKNVNDITNETSDTQILLSNEETTTINTDTTDNTDGATQDAVGGGIIKLECMRHKFGYHGEILYTNSKLRGNQSRQIGELIELCGDLTYDYYLETGGKLIPMCPINLAMIMEEIGLSEEELFEILPEDIFTTSGITNYTRENFEVLYSGDIAAIEESWCNTNEAFYHDGRCWCIWDIVDSDLETLVEASVPGDQVIRLVKKYSDNPNFTSEIINFINESTQEGLAEHFGFTSEDFSDIDADFDEMLEYRKKYFPKEGSDPQVIEYVTTLITNLENFEVSASLDMINDGKIEIGVVDGEVETEVIDGETEIQSGEEEPIVGEVTSIEDENEVDIEITQITDEQPPLADNEDVQAA